MSSTLHDDEFGDIAIKRSAKVRSITIRLAPNGQLYASAPRYAPLFLVRHSIVTNRQALRQLLHQHAVHGYQDGETIGKHHSIAVIPTQMVNRPTVRTARQKLLVSLPPEHTIDEPAVQCAIRQEVATILRREAKAYLPQRLHELAARTNLTYQRIRFSHASTRWGSCSSTGTISLNIALMKLPNELIDYVLIHELCHTHHMNHSSAFWGLVEQYDPHYRSHRQRLKHETPMI